MVDIDIIDVDMDKYHHEDRLKFYTFCVTVEFLMVVRPPGRRGRQPTNQSKLFEFENVTKITGKDEGQ